ncbi:hypothetical protein G6027_06335 [Dietzia sp. SLG310A2-38A2]|uniref:hypothetical protein n=1 Tax=Dietzia sp. SLG310A2-38A2 TaxID=1630643 RepID=UPI0015F88D7F|nr:hypothetical protein [Dietzia sp. SLG310A2-38A2]MBB1030505.1 hypothetical protein [Dietzia sp. SLG310A2-38A2]
MPLELDLVGVLPVKELVILEHLPGRFAGRRFRRLEQAGLDARRRERRCAFASEASTNCLGDDPIGGHRGRLGRAPQ